MLAVPAVPATASDLTADWLSEVLAADVVGVAVLDHAFATNQRVRIGLTYASPGAGPASLFAKLAPLDPAHREMIGATGMGEREAQFYADIAPSVALRVPRSYWSATDEQGNFVILLLGAAWLGGLPWMSATARATRSCDSSLRPNVVNGLPLLASASAAASMSPVARKSSTALSYMSIDSLALAMAFNSVAYDRWISARRWSSSSCSLRRTSR